MSTISEKLGYIKSFLTFGEMAQSSGIPSSTLSYVMSGQRKLPEKYRSDFRNLFQRTAYADMRSQGLSATQSRRFSWYSSSKVQEVADTIGTFVVRLTDKRLESFIESQKKHGTFTNITDARSTLEESIRQAIGRSDLPEERLAGMEYSNTKSL